MSQSPLRRYLISLGLDPKVSLSDEELLDFFEERSPGFKAALLEATASISANDVIAQPTTQTISDNSRPRLFQVSTGPGDNSKTTILKFQPQK